MKIGFIGLGLIGGSMAKRIKRLHPEYSIIAYNRTIARIKPALEQGVLDEITDTVDGRLGSCDILVLGTPVGAIAGYLKQLKPFLSDSCIITDVGSTKQTICEEIDRLGLSSQFVGGHPMAGSEKTGYENADEALFEGASYVLTPTPLTPQSSVELIRAMVLDLGAVPIVIDCARHDAAVAAISHVPHLAACALVGTARNYDTDGKLRLLAAGGFKDTTRVASSSPEMWEQICMTNRDAISDCLEDLIKRLEDIQTAVKSGSGQTIRLLFEEAGAYRKTF